MRCLRLTVYPLLLLICLSRYGSCDNPRELERESVQHDSFQAETEFIAHLKERSLLKNQDNPCGLNINGNFIAQLMLKSWYIAASNLIEACNNHEDKTKNIHQGVSQAASQVRKHVNQITSLLQMQNMNINNGEDNLISPSFEWSQSRDTVFISVKFAHKLDAPACIDLVDKDIEITNTTIKVAATCKNKNKKFLLELNLLKPIDPENSSYSAASVGRATLSLRKQANNTKWARLLKSRDEKPRNMHVWFALNEKYEAEMKEVEKMTLEAEKEAKAKAKADKKAAEASDDSKEAAPDAPVPPVDERTELEKEKELQLKNAEKSAKKERSKLAKQLKKELKKIDAQLKKDKQDLDKKLKEDQKELDTKASADKKAAEKANQEKLELIERSLVETKEKIQQLESADKLEGLKSLFNSVKDAIFGSYEAEKDKENPPETASEAETTTAAETETKEDGAKAEL